MTIVCYPAFPVTSTRLFAGVWHRSCGVVLPSACSIIQDQGQREQSTTFARGDIHIYHTAVH